MCQIKIYYICMAILLEMSKKLEVVMKIYGEELWRKLVK